MADADLGRRDRVAAVLPGLRAFAIPMRTRFRGITVREGALIEGPAGWAEFSPFAGRAPARCIIRLLYQKPGSLRAAGFLFWQN